jgi:DNA-binding NtrC family response regulator
VELNAHHEQAPNATAGSSGPSSKHERRQRLLIVDDERAVAMSLAEALRDDCDVFTAKSAAEARAAIGAGPSFDLILCDLGMPEESGMQLFADVSKANPELRTRFAFMTGGTLDAETARVLGRLDNPCIDKPFDVEAVRRLLTRTPR